LVIFANSLGAAGQLWYSQTVVANKRPLRRHFWGVGFPIRESERLSPPVFHVGPYEI
jgi:hypothetical protein